MGNLFFKKNLGKSLLLCFSFALFIFSFVLLINQIYSNKIKDIELFEKDKNELIKLEKNEVSFVYMIDDYDKSEPFLLNIWTLFRASKNLKFPIYFVTKNSDYSKLKSFFELNDIDQFVYLTNKLIFWSFRKGPATLLIFKKNRLVYSEAVKNLNKESKIKMWEELIKDR